MIYHVYSHYRPKNPNTIRRMALARKTWATQPWIDTPIPESECRLFQDWGGQVPYVREVIGRGCQDRVDSDIVVFTNADICVASKCCFTIVAALQSINAVYCFRRDFSRLDTPLPDPIISRGAHYCGSDLYAFRVGWWRQYKKEFPDVLLGREGWDAMLRVMMEQTQHGQNPTVYDLIYHERHGSTWEDPKQRYRLPSQRHNLALAKSWLPSWGVDPRSVGII